MSEGREVRPDDLLVVQLVPRPEAGWLPELWSCYNAERGLPDGRSEERPLDHTNAPWFIEELRLAKEKFEAGNLIALLDALHICRVDRLPVPDWVLSGMEGFMVETVTKGAPGKRGRCNNPLARARQTVRQQKQRAVIDGIRQAQKVSPDAEILHFVMLSNEVKTYFQKHGPLPLGSNLQDAVRIAEKCLRGTEFQATFSTLERLAKDLAPTGPSRFQNTAYAKPWALPG